MAKTLKPKPTAAQVGRDRCAFSAPDHVHGCRWEAWGGPFGITLHGTVYDGSSGGAIGDAGDLADADRIALGAEMIRRWTDFIRGQSA